MNLRENVGMLDTTVRSILAVVFFVLVTEALVTGIVATVLTVLGVVMLLTAAFGSCPLYKVLGINTWGKIKHNLVEH